MSRSGAEPQQLVSLTAGLVAAYVRGNPTPARELPALIAAVADALGKIAQRPVEPIAPVLTPAVPIRNSIRSDHLISLEDGRPYKSLKRHLTTRGLTPEAYRAKRGLPSDYPMFTPAYAQMRSDLAKRLGLGRMRHQEPSPSPTRSGFRQARSAPEDRFRIAAGLIRSRTVEGTRA